MPETLYAPEDEIFLGRADEQERFRESLRSLLRDQKPLSRARDWFAEKDRTKQPFVFLISGIGGMGKTRLTRRLCDIARQEEEFRGHFRVLYLDWEAQKEKDMRLKTHDAVRAETVYEHLYALFRDAELGREFDPFEDALKKRGEVETKVSQALNQKAEGGDRFAVLRELGGKGLAWIVRSGVIGGVPLPIPEEPAAKAFETIIGGGAEGLARAREQATTFLRATLTDPADFDLFTLPNETLARKLAEGIRAASRGKPTVIALDTYEIADYPDVWLREVIQHAGPRTLWVISGRNDLAESRSQYGPGSFRGYRAEFSSERLRVLPLGEFSEQDIAEYFAWRTPERPLDRHELQAMGKATLNIPLAVREAAALWKAGKALEEITGDMPTRAGREHIVKVMTERFLLHCLHDPHHPQDKVRLYALALAHRPEPNVLAAMLDTERLEAELGDLERRHSFVFIGEMKLHSAAEAFLREYLLHDMRRTSPEVRGIHGRAIQHLQTRRAERETMAITLEARVEDERWADALLGLTHHQFWLDEEAGYQVLIPAFIGGLAYDRDFARSLVEMATPFIETFTKKGKKRLKTLQAGWDYFSELEEEHHLLTEIEASSRFWPEDGNEAERRAILALRRGQFFYRKEQYPEALTWYERAEGGLPKGGESLRKQLANALYELSSALIWPKGASSSIPTKEGEKASEMAVYLDPTNGSAHYNYACVLRENGDKEKSLEFYLKAIQLDSTDADFHNGLGNVYSELGRHEDALAAYQQAIHLDHQLAYPHNGLGTVYHALGRHKDALAAYQQAIHLDPKYATPHNGLGNLYRDLGRHKDALAAFQQAILLDPKDAFPHNGLGQLYSLEGDYTNALARFQKAIDLAPGIASFQSSLAGVFRKLGREVEAQPHLQAARELMAKETEYNRACIECICGNVEAALALLQVALEKKQASLIWAQQDPDFELIREDPRFKALVGM